MNRNEHGYGAPAAPVEAPGFGAGVSAVFSGLRFVVTTPSAWPLALVPVVIALIIAVLVGVLGYELVPRLIEPLFHRWAHGKYDVLRVVARVLIAALSLVIGVVVGFALAQPLSGTALEKIVRKVEAPLGVPAWPETTILQDIWRSLEGLLIMAVLSLPLFAVLVLVGLVFPPATVITVPLKLALAALLLAWDLCDYPLSIRGMPIRARIALLRRHLGAVLGFGLGLSLLCLLPCGLFLALPAGAAGATYLVVQIERSGR